MPDPGLPRIAILGTGGTIAAQPAAGREYSAAGLSLGQILQGLPDITGWARLSSEQLVNVGSQTMDYGNWAAIGARVRELSASGLVDGIVITHGTDTLEETAYFLGLTVRFELPVVLTGAMRPSHVLGFDGAANIFQAIAVAADPAARNRGVLVVMNEQIHSARDVQKMAANGLGAFASPNQGPLGRVQGRNVRFFAPAPFAHAADGGFAVFDPAQSPTVFILYSHGDLSIDLVRAMLALKPAGIVLAGVGEGNTTDAAIRALANAAAQGVVVLRSTRTGCGCVRRNIEIDDDRYGFVAAQDLNPQKARILLMLALQKTRDVQRIQRIFSGGQGV